jgi:tetratricopeptide (TPR) repeat protein
VGVVKTGQVFVSRTSDMAAYPGGRSFAQAALDAVVRAGFAPVDMRYFAAGEGPPAEYCRQRVRDCDVYVAVIGLRYGSLVPGEPVSYTEVEFAEATALGHPRLVFLLDEGAGLLAGLPGGMVDTDRTAVNAFRDRLRQAGLVLGSFTTPEGLELAVFHALTQLCTGPRSVPHQLPGAVAHFAGRSAELAALSGLLSEGAEAKGAVVISAIGGTAGVGKTALAVHWAHQVAERFPDGQLYVNLRGFDPRGQVLDPADAVRQFLDALEVPPERIPVDLDAQAALYRSLLAGRRMLIVLDNARDTTQVRPLMPGTPGCLVLVTSRNAVAGLVATEDAHPLTLDLLAETEARQLLTRRLGADRVGAEPDAVQHIIAACARLPLALAIVAARAAAHPHFPLRALAEELRNNPDRLDALIGDDPASDLRAVISWSYQRLLPDAARVFRLLALHPGPDVSAAAAASLTGLPPRAARRSLAELAHAHVVLEHIPGRYAMHDLLRAYATEQINIRETDPDRRAAVHRMLDHYLHTAYRGARAMHPSREALTLPSPQPGVTPEDLHDHDEALAWFQAGHPVLLALVDRAAATGFDAHAWQLAWTLDDFHQWRGHWHDWETTSRVAVAAAERLGDPAAQAITHRLLGLAYTLLGRLDEARTELQQALDLYDQGSDQAGQAHAHLCLAAWWGQQGDHTKALNECRKGLDLSQAAGHRAGRARALNNIGWYSTLLGDHVQALSACQEALSLNEQIGERAATAFTWDSLGLVHRHLGHQTQAIACHQRALDTINGAGYHREEATFLTNLGDTQHEAGDLQGARAAWQQALTILDDLRAPDAEQVRSKLTASSSPDDAAQGARPTSTRFWDHRTAKPPVP